MTSPMRLRDSETAPRLLRLALDAPDDEPSEVELRSLAAGIGIAGIGSMPVPAPHVDATAVAAAAKATLATKAVATIGGSKILALVVGPALAGALAGTALLTTTVSMKPRPSHEVPAMTAPVELLPQPEPVHVAPPQPIDPPTIPTVEPATPLAPPRSASPSTPPRAEGAIDPAPPIVAVDPALAAATRPETEVAFLERAKGLVESNPDRALALASEHATRFPKGMLHQEAEVIAIEALARAGLMGAAAERLGRFQQSFPASAYLPHLVTVVRLPK